jgi:hypothetical protein
MGPTNRADDLPGDVRMPFRSKGIQAFTGKRYRQIDSLACVIDTEVTRDAQGALTPDRSRHVGLGHVLNAHPHATREEGADEPSYMLRDVYIDDPTARLGSRHTDIEGVHLAENCPGVKSGQQPCRNHIRQGVAA